MSNQDVVESHRVPRGMTRQTMLSGWNFPLTWLLPVIGLPTVIAFANRNVFWLLLIPFFTLLARRLADDRDNNPRLAWLSVVSGSVFATRERGVEAVHALEPDADCLGLLHD